MATRLMPPDLDEQAHLNELLASVESTIKGPSRWQHRLNGFDYH